MGEGQSKEKQCLKLEGDEKFMEKFAPDSGLLSHYRWTKHGWGIGGKLNTPDFDATGKFEGRNAKNKGGEDVEETEGAAAAPPKPSGKLRKKQTNKCSGAIELHTEKKGRTEIENVDRTEEDIAEDAPHINLLMTTEGK